ncbi:MAG: TIM barrel protein [Candidatus Latescibacteria bacterium]|nr:TIM barrel protein [Candidatus Latescibacterota bacterium]
MHRAIIAFIGLLFFSLTTSHLHAEESNQAAYPLGVFNFDFGRLGEDEAGQISTLQSIGYTGLVMNLTPHRKLSRLEQLHRYQAAIDNDAFKIYAGYVVVYFGQDMDAQNAHIDQVIQTLKKSNAKLWVILRVRRGQKVEREQVVAFLRSAAERTKAAGVELVIYPHDSASSAHPSIIESAEEAIPYLEEVQNGNFFISLHLCHEIRAGNGDRLDEVAAKIKPWLRLPSINGADVDAVNEVKGWKRGIQPLVLGDYDSSKLLKALKSIDYKGPVILHTWGLQKAAADHHHTSFKRFQDMLEKL